MSEQTRTVTIRRPSDELVLRALESVPVFPVCSEVSLVYPVRGSSDEDILSAYRESGVIPGFGLIFRYYPKRGSGDDRGCGLFLPTPDQRISTYEPEKIRHLELYAQGGKPSVITLSNQGFNKDVYEDAHKGLLESVRVVLREGYCFQKVELAFGILNRIDGCLGFNRDNFNSMGLKIESGHGTLEDWFRGLGQQFGVVVE